MPVATHNLPKENSYFSDFPWGNDDYVRRSMSRYLCHLHRRNGRTQTELDLHDGDPPSVGTVFDVVVADKIVAGRIGSFGVDPNRSGHDPIIHVYMNEIDW
jgi:hypothetical protein